MASADRFISVANALAARRAGARSRDNSPRHTEKYPEIHGRGMSHHLDVRGGVDSLSLFFVDHPTEVANRFRRAGGRTIGCPQPAAFHQRIIMETGIDKSQFTGASCH